MLTIDVPDVTEPHIQEPAMGVRLAGSLDTSTLSVTKNNNVLNFEGFHCKLNHSVHIHISRQDLVGDVSVDEHFAWLGLGELVWRDP